MVEIGQILSKDNQDAQSLWPWFLTLSGFHRLGNTVREAIIEMRKTFWKYRVDDIYTGTEFYQFCQLQKPFATKLDGILVFLFERRVVCDEPWPLNWPECVGGAVFLGIMRLPDFGAVRVEVNLVYKPHCWRELRNGSREGWKQTVELVSVGTW